MPMGTSLCGDLVAKTPTVSPLSLGGATLARQCLLKFPWNQNTIHTCEYCSIPSSTSAGRVFLYGRIRSLPWESGANIPCLGVPFFNGKHDSNTPSGSMGGINWVIGVGNAITSFAWGSCSLKADASVACSNKYNNYISVSICEIIEKVDSPIGDRKKDNFKYLYLLFNNLVNIQK